MCQIYTILVQALYTEDNKEEGLRNIHLCVSIRGLLSHSRAELKRDLRWITRDDGSRYASVDELRESLMDELAAGRKVLPTGDCEGFSYQTGCPGHEVPT